MIYSLLLAFLIILITLSIKPISDRLLLPYSVIIVILGFVGSEIFVSFGFDTGIRHDNFYWISNYFFIPILVFNTALSFDSKNIKKDLLRILLLTLPVFLLTLMITAPLLYFGMAHPTGFPWMAAFLTAVLLSATQSSVVIDLLKKLNVPSRIITLLESESLLSDLLAIVLFSFLLNLAIATKEVSVLSWIGLLIWQLAAGVGVGWLIGFFACKLIKLSTSSIYQAILTLLITYATYLLVQDILQASGVLAVLLLGLQLRRQLDKQEHVFIFSYWQANTLLATLAVFLLLGVTVMPSMFTERWLAMLIGIAAIVIARFLGTLSSMTLLSKTGLVPSISFSEQILLALSGTRGAIAIALAFMIPESLDYWWTIQSIAFGVVLFTLVIQAPAAAWSVKWFWGKSGNKQS